MKLKKIISQLNMRRADWKGSAREAFYDKKSKLVFKRVIDCSSYNLEHYRWSLRQHEREIEIINNMTEEEKSIFPVVTIYTDKTSPKKEKWIVMRKANHFKCYNCPDPDDCHFLEWAEEQHFTNGKQFMDFIKKYNLRDVFQDNLGYIGHRLVVIDSGL